MAGGYIKLLGRLHRAVVGSESWGAAWELVKAELSGDPDAWPSLAGIAVGGLTLIGTLATDVGWVGIGVLTFCAFVAGRGYVIQQQAVAHARLAGRGAPLPDPAAHPPPLAAPSGLPQPEAVKASHAGIAAPETDEDRQKKHELIAFIVDAALPAYEAQRKLQEQILGVIVTNGMVSHFAKMGIKNSEPSSVLLEQTTFMKRLIEQGSIQGKPFAQINKYVWTFVSKYPGFVDNSVNFLKDEPKEVIEHRAIQVVLAKWANAHTNLVT